MCEHKGAAAGYSKLIMGKVEFTQLQNWVTQRDFNAWAIKTGAFAAYSVPLILKNFHFFHFHTGEPFLITPEC